MIVYFLRHALAENREDWEGNDDLRPITKRGEERTILTAKMLKDLGVAVDLIITSPLKRALQTAEIAADVLEIGLREDERLGPGFGPKELAEILEEHQEMDAVMVVGHEPDFSETISAIIGGCNIVMKKGGLARVDLDDITSLEGNLVWLIPPKVSAR